MENNKNTAKTWRRLALPVSIILNLFFIALIGGHLLNVRGIGTYEREPFARALARAESSLSAPDAKAFNAVMRQDAPQYEPAARQLAKARQALILQITADDFDPGKTRHAMTAWEAAWTQFFNDVNGPLVDAFAQITPEGRRKLAAVRWVAPRRTVSVP